MAITISGSGIISANIADGTIVNADINSSAAIDGSKLTGVGKVLQVVQGTYSTAVTNATNVLADTGLTATITPTLATSKILVIVQQNGAYKTSGAVGNSMNLKLLRASTVISLISTNTMYEGLTNSGFAGTVGTQYLDSPATTSATTYKTTFRNDANAASVSVQINSEMSTITLMEIGV